MRPNRSASSRPRGVVPRAGADPDVPDQKWLDVSLNRINNAGVRMDNLRGTEDGEGDVTEVGRHLEKIHAQGTGVIGMKIMGEGAFSTPSSATPRCDS